MAAYAHSRNSLGQRQDLVAHLRAVAELAAEFAAPFADRDTAYYLGLCHDIGKFHPDFQRYLLEAEAGHKRRGPDHKAAGAGVAARCLGLAALVLQGHHGGLQAPNDLKLWLRGGKEQAAAATLSVAQRELPELQEVSSLRLPDGVVRDSLALELWLRLLFSALVDADYLDTEQHFLSGGSAPRGAEADIEALWRRFEHDQQSSFAGSPGTEVNLARRQVYDACLAAAEREPGLFRLTVPTGGGKTRSGMAFALRHALRWGLERVIVAVPFISITEQTAGEYRAIFDRPGEQPAVLEHHSGVSARGDGDEEEDTPERLWSRLASENWDARIIVTTTVQLFESLFANSPSRTRKLHNLAKSVIIVDEAQSLPAHLLRPILDVLRELTSSYRTTVVLSTATQPAFEAISEFASVDAREIVPQPERLFAALRRVRYEWRDEPALSWAEAAGLMRSERSALAVLNTKKNALDLMAALEDPGALHLSTLLCGAHRHRVIEEVKRRLKGGEPCRLVSTQVVEAGVDLDFPLVLRALGPLDAIIQAAGRCNREGKLAEGRVIVFQPEEGRLPPGAYTAAAGITGALRGRGNLDPDDPAAAREYFRLLFDSVATDREGIQPLRERLEYPEVAKRFHMIDDDTVSVVVTEYGNEEQKARVRDMLERLRRKWGEPRRLMRALQPYIVSLRRREAERYQRLGFVTEVLPGLGQWHGRYDAVRGLSPEGVEPDALVI